MQQRRAGEYIKYGLTEEVGRQRMVIRTAGTVVFFFFPSIQLLNYQYKRAHHEYDLQFMYLDRFITKFYSIRVGW